MNLLYSLFPKLENTNDDVSDIPIFTNIDCFWEIFSDDDSDNLENQIGRIKSGDFVENNDISDVFIDESEGPVLIESTAKIGKYVQIEGPAYIGKNVIIRHCSLIRKGSWICNNALLGHCSEIKNSLMLPGSKAPHFNYIGDSILGHNSNIGSGAKLSNVRNDKRDILITNEIGERKKTGLLKLGAIIGENVRIGCNVVTNPGTIIYPESKISPNENVGGFFKN